MTSEIVKPTELRPSIDRYRADVIVRDGKVDISPFRPEGRPASSRLEHTDRRVHVYKNGTVQLDFLLLTESYRFPAIDPLSVARRVGPFDFDYADGHPLEQERFTFPVPPSCSVVLDDQRRLATVQLTNAYDHTETFLYELLVSVAPETGGARIQSKLAPGDPTILEDADPPPDIYDASRRSC